MIVVQEENSISALLRIDSSSYVQLCAFIPPNALKMGTVSSRYGVKIGAFQGSEQFASACGISAMNDPRTGFSLQCWLNIKNSEKRLKPSV